jgi:hypothetical protein
VVTVDPLDVEVPDCVAAPPADAVLDAAGALLAVASLSGSGSGSVRSGFVLRGLRRVGARALFGSSISD